MSVTNLNVIDKADVLVAGLRKHPKKVKELGIISDAINRPQGADAYYAQDRKSPLPAGRMV